MNCTRRAGFQGVERPPGAGPVAVKKRFHPTATEHCLATTWQGRATALPVSLVLYARHRSSWAKTVGKKISHATTCVHFWKTHTGPSTRMHESRPIAGCGSGCILAIISVVLEVANSTPRRRHFVIRKSRSQFSSHCVSSPSLPRTNFQKSFAIYLTPRRCDLSF
jgi:hypothetical protein